MCFQNFMSLASLELSQKFPVVVGGRVLVQTEAFLLDLDQSEKINIHIAQIKKNKSLAAILTN